MYQSCESPIEWWWARRTVSIAGQRSGQHVLDPRACERGLEIRSSQYVGLVRDLERGTTAWNICVKLQSKVGSGLTVA